MIKYVKGDLFDYIIDKDNFLIPHICNNKGKWASGFVVPLGQKFPEAKYLYLNSSLSLGTVTFAIPFVDTAYGDVYVANMVCQAFYDRKPRPLYYNYLVRCMEKVAKWCLENDVDIIAPKFGSLRAGGNWNFIQDLIYDCWDSRGINVTIVEYNVSTTK